MENNHISVQKEKVIKYLNINPNGIYVDCTFGRGGHSLAILEKLSPNGLLISIDKDEEAAIYYDKFFPKYKNHIFVKNAFSNIKKILVENNIDLVDGILFDFGLSSPMYDNANRGFSYKKDGVLDMRIDQSQEFTAKILINTYSHSQLINIFKKNGDIKNPKYVVDAIVKYREKKEITNTIELVEIIRGSIHIKELNKKKHFAKQYFQAIRIEVNKELDEIFNGTKQALSLLKSGGRMVTISFHTLEEKEVKKSLSTTFKNIFPKELPINNIENEYKIINVKDKWADDEEISKNNRSRSSLLKIIERK